MDSSRGGSPQLFLPLACCLPACAALTPCLLCLLCRAADPEATAVTATDVLLYCYYGGMVEIGRRRYARAMELLGTAITAPTMVLNAITVACLKKYLLLGLIHNGGPRGGGG